MLYDPKWEKQVKADPFEIGTLIAWLEKQPARETYCFASTGHCLFAQYFKAHGLTMGDGYHRTGHHGLNWNIPIAGDGMHTFGEALKRARKIAARS